MGDYIYYVKDFKRNRINMYFSVVPNYNTRAILKRNGWRYSPENLCWYTYISKDTERVARSIGATDGTDYSANEGTNDIDQESIKLHESFTKMFGRKPPHQLTSVKQFEELLDAVNIPAPRETIIENISDENIGVMLINSDRKPWTIILSDSIEAVDNKRIFSLSGIMAGKILNNIIEEKNYVIIKSQIYRMAVIAYSKNHNALMHSKIIRNENSPVKIQIYKLKMPCTNHKKAVECVTAYVQIAAGGLVKPISIFYCPICNNYYINSEQYKEFVKKNGLPFITLDTDHNGINRLDFESWNEESILHYMGYNVSSVEGLSANERQRILKHAIDTQSLTKAEVESFLEFLIYHNQYSYKMENACHKWNEDLRAIRLYKRDNQRKVLGEF